MLNTFNKENILKVLLTFNSMTKFMAKTCTLVFSSTDLWHKMDSASDWLINEVVRFLSCQACNENKQELCITAYNDLQ